MPDVNPEKLSFFPIFLLFFVSCAFQSHLTQNFSNPENNSGMKTG